jgi:hypothetical protein
MKAVADPIGYGAKRMQEILWLKRRMVGRNG